MTLTNDDIQKIGQLFDTRLKPLEDKIERTREELQSGLGKVEDELQEVKADVRNLQEGFRKMQGELHEVQDELQEVKADVRNLQEGFHKMQGELQEVKFKVTKIDIYVESEIRVNIQRVAEGHLDLSRKLNDCIGLSNEVKARQEIQDVYLNMHEAKLKAM